MFLLSWIQEGTAPLNLYIDEEFVRASPGGAGGVKTITNYAPVRNMIKFQCFNIVFLLCIVYFLINLYERKGR